MLHHCSVGCVSTGLYPKSPVHSVSHKTDSRARLLGLDPFEPSALVSTSGAARGSLTRRNSLLEFPLVSSVFNSWKEFFSQRSSGVFWCFSDSTQDSRLQQRRLKPARVTDGWLELSASSEILPVSNCTSCLNVISQRQKRILLLQWQLSCNKKKHSVAKWAVQQSTSAVWQQLQNWQATKSGC